MSLTEEHIKRIYNKLQQLLKLYQLLQKEKNLLETEVKEIRLKREQEQQEIFRLQQQVLILKSSLGKMEETDKKDFEKQLNQYIKEIDKCITVLSD